MSDKQPRLTGDASRRVNGARLRLLARAATATTMARLATDERFAAAMRGKAKAYREAAELLRSVDHGGRIKKVRQ